MFLGHLYFVNITDLPTKLDEIQQLIDNVTTVLSKNNRQWKGGNETKVRINSFLPAFINFLGEKGFIMDENNNTNIPKENKSESDDVFHEHVTEFLYIGSGVNKEWKESFVFSGNESLVCGEMSPPILALKFRIQNLM